MSYQNTFSIDASNALKSMQDIQKGFLAYNSALGQITASNARFNSASDHSLQTFTQINSAGVKTITTLRQIDGVWRSLGTSVSQATPAQRKAAEVLKQQADLAGQVADAFQKKNGIATGGGNLTTAIPTVNPAKLGLPTQAFSQLTNAQLQATATARGYNDAQKAAFVSLNQNAAKANQGFLSLSATASNFGNKLGEIGKIAFATLIYRGISLIQEGLSEGTKSALDYTHQIGLIQTISQDSGESFNSWNVAIRAVADELGRPATEVAKDAYDALSNQVIKTTKDFDILRTSIILEQNTGSASGTGLDTLSGLLNGLGASSLQAQSLADKLFVTIDKGRVRLEELQATIGRTIGLQQQAGASFDETAGALAVLTQSGIKADEATTLLNNVFSEIIKPNEALSKTLRELGYDTGAAAVRAEGLAGILKTLGDLAKSTPDGLATFFPDIRGLRGAATLFTQTDQFKKSIDDIQNSAGANKAAKGILDENDAQKVLKEAERIKNYFTVDLGVGIVRTIAQISTAMGGFSNVLKALVPVAVAAGAAITAFVAINAVTTFIGAIGQLASGFLAVSKAIGIANAAMFAFGSTITAVQISFGAIAVLGTAVFLAANYAVEKYRSNLEAAASIRLKPIDDKLSKFNEDSKSSASQRVNDFNRSTDQMTSIYERFLQRARQGNNEFAESAKKSFDASTASLKNSFDVALTYIRKNTTSLEAAEEEAFDNIKKLQDEINNTKVNFGNDKRDRQVDKLKSDFDKQKQAVEDYNQKAQQVGAPQLAAPSATPILNEFYKIYQAAIESGRKTRDAFLQAGDLKSAVKAYEGIVDAQKSYQRNVESVGGSVSVEAKATQLYQEQVTKLSAAKDILVKKEQESYNAALKQRQIQEELNDVYKAQEKIQGEVFDKKGNLTDDFSKDPKKALELFDSLRAKARDLQSKIDVGSDPIAAGRLKGAFAQSEVDSAGQRNALAAQIAAAQNGSNLTKLSQDRLALAAQEKASVEALTKAYSESSQAAAKQAATIQKALGELKASLGNTGQTVFDPSKISSFFDTTALPNAQKDQATELATKFNSQIGEANPDLNKIKSTFGDLQKVLEPIKTHRIVDPADVSNTITIEEALKNIGTSLSTFKESKNDAGEAQIKLANLQATINNLNSEGLDKVVGAITSINQGASGFSATSGGIQALDSSLSAAAQNAATLAENLERVKAAAGGAGVSAPTAPGGGPVTKADGGLINGTFLSDFLGGKYAKGSDTVPAMLTPGEYVVRAPMAKKFFSQLVAINSGQQPIYRSEGGSTTNSTAHNYNISVNGGGNPRETAKAVALEIRRAQRQGTIQ